MFLIRKSLPFIFVCLLFISGCATYTEISPFALSERQVGVYPKNYEYLIKNHFDKILKDPASAIYQITEPKKGYLRKAPISGGDPVLFGYIVIANVNAKNSFGGYVGAKEYRFLIRNNQLTQFGSNDWFPEWWYQ